MIAAAVAFALAALQAGPPPMPLTPPAAKRVAPPSVAPVTVGSTRIEVVPWSRDRGFDQTGGVIEAVDARSGASLWLLKVYAIDYAPRLETDVQDVFITRLRRAGRNRVRVDDERGRHWLVDLATRTVRPA